MSRTYDQIPPPESAISAAACGRTIRDTSVPDSLLPVSPADVDLGRLSPNLVLGIGMDAWAVARGDDASLIRTALTRA